MQNFKDSVTEQVWSFNDDVVVTDTSGVYSFASATGVPLSGSPTTLLPYTIPAPSAPTIQQQAIALLSAPFVTVSCTSLPALNGAYALDDSSRVTINGIVGSINHGSGVPGGLSTFSYPDSSGTMHAWPSSEFMLFAFGAMSYVYNLEQVAISGGSLPGMTITIP